MSARRGAPGWIVRECAIAFAILLVFVFCGRYILAGLGLSDSSLTIAGGVILFLIALRMIFRHPEGIFGDTVAGEPFIVPLATPSIAGPATIATVVLMESRAPERLLEWSAAVTVAMFVTLVLLLLAERISRLAGERGLLAFERLMGLIFDAIARHTGLYQGPVAARDRVQVLAAIRPAAERHGWAQPADQLALGIGAWTCRGHQLRSPNRVIMAGTRKLRTMNVSNRMPSATPMPICTIV